MCQWIGVAWPGCGCMPGSWCARRRARVPLPLERCRRPRGEERQTRSQKLVFFFVAARGTAGWRARGAVADRVHTHRPMRCRLGTRPLLPPARGAHRVGGRAGRSKEVSMLSLPKKIPSITAHLALDHLDRQRRRRGGGQDRGGQQEQGQGGGAEHGGDGAERRGRASCRGNESERERRGGSPALLEPPSPSQRFFSIKPTSPSPPPPQTALNHAQGRQGRQGPRRGRQEEAGGARQGGAPAQGGERGEGERKRRDATARGRWHVRRERTRARPSRRRRPWAGPCCPRPPHSTPTDHALGIQLPIAPGVGEPARGFVARERVTSRGAARREKDPGRRPALFFFLFFSRFLLPTPRQDSSSDDSSSEDDSESEGLAAGTPAANGVRWVGRGRGEGGRRGGTRAPRLLDATPMGVASHVGGRRGQCFPAHPPRTAAWSVAKRVLGA